MTYNYPEVMTMRPMDPDQFESSFAEFWESRECTDLNQVLYDLIKAAFSSGCRAAGAEPPTDGQREAGS